MGNMPIRLRWFIIMMMLWQVMLYAFYGVIMVFWLERPKRSES